eukprot:9649527-Prorocentrum_lima.AAC.1
MPSPSRAATSRLTSSFNQIVQHDILFVDSHVEQSRVGSTASRSAIPPLQAGHKDPWNMS